ncbi:MAG: carbohydrate ABC transporter permease [Clostridiales bacterium]|nr:carbohydrate ABC transporter permease [Clostridiales bacterium]
MNVNHLSKKELKSRHKINKVRQSKGDTAFDVVITTFLIFAVIVVAYPLIYVVSASLSSTDAVMGGRVWLLPVEFSLEAYKTTFKYDSIMTGYLNSLIYTASGTVVSLILTTLCAYCLSKTAFYGRKLVGFLVLFTMLFNAGLVPNYLLINNTLKWGNTIWALIIPNAMSAWHVILVRTYFENSIPGELFEAGDIDGCSVFRQLISIALPMSGPILAVIALYTAVGLWNGYFDALIYISDKDMFPLQLVLRNILILNSMDMTTSVDLREMASRQGMYNLLKYAVIVVSSLPLLLMYPFVQKYFVKGIMVGSVKG